MGAAAAAASSAVDLQSLRDERPGFQVKRFLSDLKQVLTLTSGFKLFCFRLNRTEAKNKTFSDVCRATSAAALTFFCL